MIKYLIENYKCFVFTFCIELEKRPQPQLPRSSEELEDLHKLLHFPEEVALRLTESEYQLFYQVQPCEYLRHVAQDLTSSQSKLSTKPPPSPTSHQHHQQQSRESPSTANSSTQTDEEALWLGGTTSALSVQTLINRFNEVLTFLNPSPTTWLKQKKTSNCHTRDQCHSSTF